MGKQIYIDEDLEFELDKLKEDLHEEGYQNTSYSNCIRRLFIKSGNKLRMKGKIRPSKRR